MKPAIFVLSALVLVSASNATPVVQSKRRIDTRALALLARVAAKYETSAYYRGEMMTSFGRAGSKSTDDVRGTLFVTNIGDLDLTRKIKGRVSRIVSDGNTVLLTRSDRPRNYELERLATPRFKRESILLRADFEGFVSDALSRRLGQLLVEPGLQSLDMGKPVRIGGALLRTILIAQTRGSGKRHELGMNRIYIAADDTIRLVESLSTSEDGGTWIWREKHWNIKLGAAPQPHPDVKPPTGLTPDKIIDSSF